ncbi:hypothetical protein J4E90_003823 [Alternaria incomplexa]|uniref:uncharacterized protein n=1 Tax=Alternaria incomplexa TaxID=1187928 RepID=UPI0022204247|nr:uncharacterized protein J4E90_003823 [Alternaria incomplexa]KAI4917316.1 hypothetical protein J4E90_003823 [Alternaria incomplexa]
MAPKKKATAKPEDLLQPEQLRLIEDHMDDDPCILCGERHSEKDGKAHAWLCPKINTPVSSMAWINKNITPQKSVAYAKGYIKVLQQRGSIPSRTSEQPIAPPEQEAPADQVPDSSEPAEEQKGQTQAPTQAAQTEPDVTEEEKNEALQAVDQKEEALKRGESRILSQYPPQKGSCGTITDAVKTKVTTIFFKIGIDEKTIFYEYQILDLPVGQNKKKLEKLVRTMIDSVDVLRKNKDSLATDNISTIISWKKLHDKKDDERFTGPHKIPDGRRDGTNVERELKLKLLRELDFSKLREYVGGHMDKPHLWDSSVEVKALNILISKSLNTDEVIRIGANKFFVTGRKQYLSPSLMTMQGYFYTIKPLQAGIVLNVNYGTSAFYRSQTVDEFLKDTETFSNERTRWAALNALRVEIRYGRGKDPKDRQRDWNDVSGREKTVSGTSRETPLKDLKFDKKMPDGSTKKKEVLKYLKEAYPKEFKDETGALPGINLGIPSDKEWFAAGKLQILRHQIYRRPVPDHLTDTMLKRAALTPKEGVPLIDNVFDFLKIKQALGSDSVTLADCQPLTIVPKLLNIDSTTMRYPSIIYGANKKKDLYIEHVGKGKSGETPRWTLKDCEFLESGPTVSAGVQVYLLTTSETITLQATLKEVLQRYNIGGNNKDSKFLVTRRDLLNFEFDQLHQALRYVKETFNEGRKKIVVLLLPKPDRQAYQFFKDLADREFGLHAVCITEPKVFADAAKVEQYLGNVMMKVNLKCEGINHSAGDSVAHFEQSLQHRLKDTMLLGADVTHPSLVSIDGCPSIAALVGSVDDFGGKFLGSMRLQNPDRTDREIIQEVESMTVERLRAYYDYPIKPKNAPTPKPRLKLPTRMIYYRDGVSEGQFGKVVEQEVRAIKSAFERVKKEKKWKGDLKLTSIVVTKRHHTRFYPTKEEDKEGKGGNCKPGTVIDTSVTSPYFKEFFLQSHSGLQGTTKPAHYFVVQDDADWDVAELATFTHQLSYTYVRASCGVSYAPPAYYADRLCERGRIYLRSFLNGDTDVAEELKKKKTDLEDHQRKIRKSIYKPIKEQTKTATGVWPAKTRGEEIMELLHKDEVAKECKKWALEEAAKVWGKWTGTDAERKNPWNKALDNTMFWM